MDFEQLGVFYLGREVDEATMQVGPQPLLYDSSDLTTHAVIVGMTGSGKTGLGVGLIEEAAIDGIPVLAIDPKGDLGNLALTFPRLAPEEFLPWVDARDAERLGLSVEEYAAQQAQQWREGLADWDQEPDRIQRLRNAAEVVIYTPGSSAGRPINVLRSFAAPPPAVAADADLWNERLSTTVTGLLTLLGWAADPLSREQILLASILDHAWQEGRDLGIADLIQAVQTPPLKRLGVMDLETVFPAKERLKLALALNALLAAPTFQAWTTGDPLDIQSLLYAPDGRARVAVVSIAHLSDAERNFFLSLLLSEVVSWTRSQSGTSSLRALVYIDELFGFLPPVAEPPTKKPLLTLLKQARAFGVGLALATQNPVDLDYKALSNAGTWFVGRLQTERDRLRLLEGLRSAAPGGLTAPQLDGLIGRLGKRTFLLHNVHDKQPRLFQTRWVMSYLAGPLSREQIGRLSAATAGQAEEAAPRHDPPTTLPVAVEPHSRPFLPAGVPQLYFPAAGGSGASYFPLVLGVADVHYSSKTYGVEETARITRLTELPAGVVGLEWTEGRPGDVPLEQLATEPTTGIGFQPLPELPLDERTVKGWTDLFQRWLRVDGALTLLRHPKLKLVSDVHESETEFRLRCLQLLREQRDAAKEKLRQKYATKSRTLQRRELTQAQAVERQQQQAQSRSLDAVVTVGGALLGAFLGKRMPSTSQIGTAVRRGSSVSTQRGDVERAREALAQTRAELTALEGELQRELDVLASGAVHADDLELETVSIKPTTRDVVVRYVGIAWVPFVRSGSGRWIPDG